MENKTILISFFLLLVPIAAVKQETVDAQSTSGGKRSAAEGKSPVKARQTSAEVKCSVKLAAITQTGRTRSEGVSAHQPFFSWSDPNILTPL